MRRRRRTWSGLYRLCPDGGGASGTGKPYRLSQTQGVAKTHTRGFETAAIE